MKVLDLGCAFGYGTGILARDHEVYGHDLSAPYVRRARRRLPAVRFTSGPASAIPYGAETFDAVVMLDVLEHVPDREEVIAEVARVTKPRGALILSVPHRGALAWLDSLNVYRRLFGDTPPLPTDDPSWPESPHHAHFTVAELDRLLAPHFRRECSQLTGLGLAEVINLALLLVVLRLMRMPKLYARLQYLYFGAYILEDEFSAGRFSYHLMARYRRL